jgi:hypothetical protein
VILPARATTPRRVDGLTSALALMGALVGCDFRTGFGAFGPLDFRDHEFGLVDPH